MVKDKRNGRNVRLKNKILPGKNQYKQIQKTR